MTFDTIATVLRRALLLGGLVGGAIGVVTGAIGLVVAGWGGLASGLVGAALTIAFLGITAAGMLVVGRVGGGGDSIAPFAVLMGAWFAKLVVFVFVMLLLRAQPWVVPGVLLASIVGTVIGSLVVDALVVGRARIPVSNRV